MASPSAATFHEEAPAKVNLALHVTGRRPDGYHLLDSIVVFADLADRLAFTPSDRTTLRATGPAARGMPLDRSNLAWRARDAMAEAYPGRIPELAIAIAKEIPMSSGLGGGSADAAATMRGLARLSGIDGRDGRLLDVAASLGADVPVCLAGRAARMEGTGERVTPLVGCGPFFAVLARPDAGLSTAEIYSRLGGRTSDGLGVVPASITPAWLAGRRNDLELPAHEASPDVRALCALLAGCEDAMLSRMTGSGSACFALFPGPEAAAGAARAVARARPAWWVRSVRLGGQ